VHVRGLRVQGEDSNVQWLLRVEETDATIAVGELLHRTFHATRSRSSGVSVVARLKMPRGDATPERLFGLAQIAGFDPLPLKTEGPDELDTEERYRLWTIHLDDTVAEVREMWTERFHLTGSALVTGGFFLKPVRRAQVEGQLQASSLELRVGDDLVAKDLRGHLAVSLHPFDPREVQGLDVLGQVSLRARFDGQLAGLEFLQRMLPLGIRVQAAPGPLVVDLQVDRGKVSPGSALDLRSPRMSLQFWRLRAEGEAALELRTADAQATVALELLSFSLAPLGGFPMPMRAQRARVEVTGDRLDLTRALSWRSFVADLEGGAVPDLQLFEPLLPRGSGVRIESGQASLSGHMEGTPHASHGHIDFAAHEATVSAAGERLRASLHGQARLHANGLGSLDLSGSKVSLDHVNLLHASNAPDWWGRFKIPAALLDPEAQTLVLRMTGTAAMRARSPVSSRRAACLTSSRTSFPWKASTSAGPCASRRMNSRCSICARRETVPRSAPTTARAARRSAARRFSARTASRRASISTTETPASSCLTWTRGTRAASATKISSHDPTRGDDPRCRVPTARPCESAPVRCSAPRAAGTALAA